MKNSVLALLAALLGLDRRRRACLPPIRHAIRFPLGL
jgi:hypothetical protein